MSVQISSNTNRRSASKKVRAALVQSGTDVPAEVQFVTELPPKSDHQKHYMGPVSNNYRHYIYSCG